MSRPKATVRPKRTEQSKAGVDALMIAGDSTLDREDCVLILRALDLLERHIRDEVATAPNTIEQAPNMERWSRLLIVRTKLLRMQGGAQ